MHLPFIISVTSLYLLTQTSAIFLQPFPVFHQEHLQHQSPPRHVLRQDQQQPRYRPNSLARSLSAPSEEEEILKQEKRATVHGPLDLLARVQKSNPMAEMGCKKVPALPVFKKLNSVCEDCFRLFRDQEIYHMCRWVRISVPFFHFCYVELCRKIGKYLSIFVLNAHLILTFYIKYVVIIILLAFGPVNHMSKNWRS